MIDGDRYTIRSGEITYDEGKPVAAGPAKLARGARLAPSNSS